MERWYKNIISFYILFIIRVFKTIFSIPDGVCKYHPSCSEYAKQAIEKKPLMLALLKIIQRIIRCNPFSKGGYDPL